MEKVNFGVTKRGEEASLYVLENKNNTTIKVTDYGATLVSLLFADKAGVQKDLVLGYDNVTGYEEHISYFGAIIGRNGNRIKDSRFTINGKEYRIDENENHNNLHSGKNGFNTVIWEVREHTDNSITFYHYSSETEQKFPGNMEITVTYTIADDDTLHIVYNGKADADTVMNCTNHSYFNLNGHESGSIEGQVLQIFADAYTPVVDSSAIPTGEIASVEGTPMDFRTEKQIGQDIRADFVVSWRMEVQEIVKRINGNIHTSGCNLKCGYCYLAQANYKNQGMIKALKYPLETILAACSKERLGGTCIIEIIGDGETLLPDDVVPLILGLLKEGHYVLVINNGTLKTRIHELVEQSERDQTLCRLKT